MRESGKGKSQKTQFTSTQFDLLNTSARVPPNWKRNADIHSNDVEVRETGWVWPIEVTAFFFLLEILCTIRSVEYKDLY